MSTTLKSPFLVIQDFLTTDKCDQVASKVRVEPLVNEHGELGAIKRYHPEIQLDIFEILKPLLPKLQDHFTGFNYKGTENLEFQQFPVNSKNAEDPHCENAVFKRKKWVRINERDLTGILWLKDYQETPPFNIKQHVLGGKLEFPTYNFGFQPQKGTLVIYPSNERFISLTSPVLVGELQCVRFHFCGSGLWIYDPADYPGDFRTWFSDIV